MLISLEMADFVLAPIVEGAAKGYDDLFGALEFLQAPIYVTDSEGFVSYFNKACVGFTGRTPVAGKDRWCVTWKLYTDEGDYLPHDQCPMALAIKSGRPVRGMTAVAERPNRTRVRFCPFPTPLFDPCGRLTGAINILIDVTDARQPSELRSQAERCRLAASTANTHTANIMAQLAAEYEAKAFELEQRKSLSVVQSPATPVAQRFS